MYLSSEVDAQTFSDSKSVLVTSPDRGDVLENTDLLG
jgi:hypothetical protein